MAGIVFVASWLPIIWLQVRGGAWRKRRALKEESREGGGARRGD